MTEREPPVIGIAGGVGSGKSAVARCLADLGCIVSDSDHEAKAALDRDVVRAQLVSWWGDGVVGPDGKVDRKAVAAIVFGDAAERKRLERLIHPLVHEARRELFSSPAALDAKARVIDAPLLFEAGLEAECDAVIFVDTPFEERLARVRATRGWDEAELIRREAAQMPVAEKRARSGYVVQNSGDRADLDGRVAEVLARILHDQRRSG